jgi:hypothetical protein
MSMQEQSFSGIVENPVLFQGFGNISEEFCRKNIRA